MEFLRSLLRRRFARAQVAILQNVGCFLRLGFPLLQNFYEREFNWRHVPQKWAPLKFPRYAKLISWEGRKRLGTLSPSPNNAGMCLLLVICLESVLREEKQTEVISSALKSPTTMCYILLTLLAGCNGGTATRGIRDSQETDRSHRPRENHCSNNLEREEYFLAYILAFSFQTERISPAQGGNKWVHLSTKLTRRS